MPTASPRLRLAVARCSRVCVVVAAVGFAVSTVNLVATPSAQAETVGAVTFSDAAGMAITTGTRDTVFNMDPPAAAACSGDSATGSYLWHTYIVPAAVDPNTLSFDGDGPVPQGFGANLRLPLYDAGGSPQVNRTTAAETGQIVGRPEFSFVALGADAQTFVPAGTYNIGYACTRNLPGNQTMDRVWNAQITVTALDADSFSWTVVADPSTTTTSTSSTTTSSTTTTSTVPSGSTTTTSSVPTDSTTTSSVPAASSTTPSPSSTSLPATGGAGGGGTSGGTSGTGGTTGFGGTTGSGGTTTGFGGTTGGTLPRTGNGSTPLFVWGVLLLVFGRIAVLAARKPRVIGPK